MQVPVLWKTVILESKVFFPLYHYFRLYVFSTLMGNFSFDAYKRVHNYSSINAEDI